MEENEKKEKKINPFLAGAAAGLYPGVFGLLFGLILALLLKNVSWVEGILFGVGLFLFVFITATIRVFAYQKGDPETDENADEENKEEEPVENEEPK